MLKIGVIEIQVKNFYKSVEFYKKKLQLKILAIEHDDKFAMFDTGKVRLSLWEVKNIRKRPSNIKIYFPVKNIHKEVLLLKNKGVKFKSKIEKRHWGFRACFIDNEKNEHFLYQEN